MQVQTVTETIFPAFAIAAATFLKYAPVPHIFIAGVPDSYEVISINISLNKIFAPDTQA